MIDVATRLAIEDLMTGWIHRDLGRWDALRELFHPDATVEIAWYQGSASEFVERSAQMGKESDLTSKHVIASPSVRLRGDRAVVETNVLLVSANASLRLGALGHSRFYDRVECRDGEWRLLHRQSIYDMAGFTFPAGVVEIDDDIVERHPLEYAAIAYLLEKSGYPVTGTFATKGSEEERRARAEAEAWLGRATDDPGLLV